jgi:hypothetical protein
MGQSLQRRIRVLSLKAARCVRAALPKYVRVIQSTPPFRGVLPAAVVK